MQLVDEHVHGNTLADNQNSSGAADKHHRLAWACIGLSFAFGTFRIFHIVNAYAVNVFFVDTWDYEDATLFQHHSLAQIFLWQKGPHRLGLGGIIDYFLGPMIHWNSRYEAFAEATILCLAALLAIVLKRRLTGKLDYADALIPILVLTPVQWQTLLVIVHPSIGALVVLLVLLYCLALTAQLPITRYACAAVVNICLIFTGYGVVFGFLSPVFFGLEYYKRKSKLALAASALSIAVLVFFFFSSRPDTGAGCFSLTPTNPLHYGLFAGFMLSTFIGIQPVVHLGPAVIAGVALLVVFLIVLIKTSIEALRFGTSLPSITSALLAYALLFCFATAYGRLCLGLGQSQSSRYMGYLTLGFFGLYLAARTVTDRLGRVLCTVAVAGLVALTSTGLSKQDLQTITSLRDGRIKWTSCYISTHNIERCDQEAGFPICWNPEPPDLRTKLDFLERNHLNLFATPQSGTTPQISKGTQ